MWSGDYEMNELKRRLVETESQMSRILQAMEVVQQKVGAAAADTADLMVSLWCFSQPCCIIIITIPSFDKKNLEEKSSK